MEKPRVCSNCFNAAEALKTCAKCGDVKYCSRACQVAHWKGGHKTQCQAASRSRERPSCAAPGQQRPPATTSGGEGSEEGGLKRAASEDSCPICMEFLPGDCKWSRVLPCGHAFHRACVDGLRAHGVAQACPICRARLPPGPGSLWEGATRRYFSVALRVERGELDWAHLGGELEAEMREVVRCWREAAEDGHALAQVTLGVKYAVGMGVVIPRDLQAAEAHYAAAADQGNAQAQYNLGNLLFQRVAAPIPSGAAGGAGGASLSAPEAAGSRGGAGGASSGRTSGAGAGGGGVDLKERERLKAAAYALWMAAADQDYPPALFNVGQMYRQGVGVPTADRERCLALWQRAAELGHPQAAICARELGQELGEALLDRPLDGLTITDPTDSRGGEKGGGGVRR